MAGLPFLKPDYPPLLPDGLHEMTLPELRALCVDGLPPSTTRNNLMTKFEEVVAALEADDIEGDLWVDGSFVTNKADAKDVDVSLRVEVDVWNRATAQQKAQIHWFAGNLSASHDCDSYVFVVYPPSHPMHIVGQLAEDGWLRQWGVDRSGNLKGIAVIRLGSTP